MHINSPGWAAKIKSSAWECVFSQKCVKLTSDELFLILKSEHVLRVYFQTAKIEEFFISDAFFRIILIHMQQLFNLVRISDK